MKERSKDVKERKEEVRKEIIRRLRSQDISLREEKSRRIQEKLLSSGDFKSSKTVMSYVSLPHEVDTRYFNEEALRRGKRVAVPYITGDRREIIASELTVGKNLEKGPFGIYIPKDGLARTVPLEEIDLVIVPAIAYDMKNMRLGRGKGYYDRFLAKEELTTSKTVGLAFRFQVVDSLPSNSNDRSVCRVITD